MFASVSTHLRVCDTGRLLVPVKEGSHHLWPDSPSLCIGSPPKCQMLGHRADTRRQELSCFPASRRSSAALSEDLKINDEVTQKVFFPPDRFSNNNLTPAVDKSSIPPKGLGSYFMSGGTAVVCGWPDLADYCTKAPVCSRFLQNRIVV